MTAIVGIDPGSKGAVACFWPEEGRLGVWNLPVTKIQGSTRVTTELDGAALSDLLLLLKPDAVYLEKVHSMPTDGHVGAFTFGGNFHSIKTTMNILRIKMILITPSVWKATMRVTADKKTSTAKAKALFPLCSKLFSRSDKSEASLIAFYGALISNNSPKTTRIVPYGN